MYIEFQVQFKMDNRKAAKERIKRAKIKCVTYDLT